MKNRMYTSLLLTIRAQEGSRDLNESDDHAGADPDYKCLNPDGASPSPASRVQFASRDKDERGRSDPTITTQLPDLSKCSQTDLRKISCDSSSACGKQNDSDNLEAH
jgi:hypothetical protein